MNRSAQIRYQEALKNIPPPGTGCHVSLLSVANYGVMAGMQSQELHDDIRHHIPPGTRPIPDGEIQDAIDKAQQDHTGGSFRPHRPTPAIRDGKSTRQKIIAQGKIDHDADLFGASPTRLWGQLKDDPALLLESLYEPSDLIFIGEGPQKGILGETIKPVSDWIAYFRAGGRTAPHFIPNPLTGLPAAKKNGAEGTLRGDNNIKSFRFAVVEFDDLPWEHQMLFWSAISLPIFALISTAGKSIHALIDVQQWAEVKTSDQWDAQIRDHLYDQILVPMGVDSSCKNPSRLSRLPGHFRSEKKNFQKLLWLSPKGRGILL